MVIGLPYRGDIKGKICLFDIAQRRKAATQMLIKLVVCHDK